MNADQIRMSLNDVDLAYAMARFNTVRQMTTWFDGNPYTLVHPVEIYTYAVKFLFEKGEISQSIIWLNKALNIKPNYYQALIRESEALRLCGKYSEAFHAGQRAMDLIVKIGDSNDLNWCRVEFCLAALQLNQFSLFKELINKTISESSINREYYISGFALTELVEMATNQELALKKLSDHDQYALARKNRLSDWHNYFMHLVRLVELHNLNPDWLEDEQAQEEAARVTQGMNDMIERGLGYGVYYGSRKNMLEEISNALVKEEPARAIGFLQFFINSTQKWDELLPIPYF